MLVAVKKNTWLGLHRSGSPAHCRCSARHFSWGINFVYIFGFMLRLDQSAYCRQLVCHWWWRTPAAKFTESYIISGNIRHPPAGDHHPTNPVLCWMSSTRIISVRLCKKDQQTGCDMEAWIKVLNPACHSHYRDGLDWILAGAFFVEWYIFGWQGIGLVTVDALKTGLSCGDGIGTLGYLFIPHQYSCRCFVSGVVDPRVRWGRLYVYGW